MADPKTRRLLPRSPRGLADRGPAEIRAVERMMATIRGVYERYGFEPVETPFIEYTDALGKFLPDQDRPNEGVFSFQDDDEQWLSLRYDLTAPLARHVAANYDALPKPYRSYRSGWVFRNEKPGPGRFRQFMQFDADTVGSSSPAADAEICMMAADTMEELGFDKGQYVIKVNNRKVLDGVMEAIGLGGDENAGKRLTVLRAIDKLDRLGVEGVRALLGAGREDDSGDFTKGAGLSAEQVKRVVALITSEVVAAEITDPDEENAAIGTDNFSHSAAADPRFYGVDFALSNEGTLKKLLSTFGDSPLAMSGLDELEVISGLCAAAGYGARRVQIDPSVVRGLEYYTGPVFEAQLTFPVPNEKGEPVQFGSVGGGGRYDGLVGRFRSEPVPATGFSVGVSRLAAALKAIGKLGDEGGQGPVVVTVMDRERLADYQAIVAELRNADIAAEMYLGASGMKAQLKYADRRNAPCVIIAGSDEFASGRLQVKDLVVGKAAAAGMASHADYKDERPGQFDVLRGDIVDAVRGLLAKQRGG